MLRWAQAHLGSGVVVSKPVRPVTVLTWDQEYRYPWATDIRITRRGDLQVYEGLRQRAYHHAGEWTSYTVAASGSDLGAKAPWGRQTGPGPRKDP